MISSITYNICKYVCYFSVSLRRPVSRQLHRVRPPLNPAQKRVVVNITPVTYVTGCIFTLVSYSSSPDLKLSNELTNTDFSS